MKIPGIPNNLMPYITQVAVGKLKELGVFGDDYDTPDGTGVRDYIHVVDLAKGHVKALKKLEDHSGLNIYNLGTGHGYSVLDIVKNFEAATGVKIPYVIKPRRARRYRNLLLRCEQGRKRAWLESGIRHQRDVRGFLEMAVDESERIRRLRIKVKATGRSVSVEKTLTVLF